jgi:hypothetical protein
MKYIFLLIACVPAFSFSQFIKADQVDSFTGQKRIVTQWVALEAGVSLQTNGLNAISFNTVNSNIYIVLHGGGKSAGTILPDDIALLITDKDTILIKSAGMQVSYGRWDPYYYDHEYLIDPGGLVKLSQNKLRAVRRYTSEGIVELDIKEKYRDKIMELCDALLKEMGKK